MQNLHGKCEMIARCNISTLRSTRELNLVFSMVKTINTTLNQMVGDFSKLKMDHDPRIAALEKNFIKICQDLYTLVNLSKDSLETITKGLVLLNEKAKD